MLPDRYKRVKVARTGRDPHSCLEIEDVPLEAPRAHELLVRHHYAGVNASDVGRMMGVDGWSQDPPFNFGIEAIGEVVAVGDRVEDYEVGQAVATAFPGNGYSEYGIIDRNFALKIPAIDPQYVGIFISGTSAKIALNYVADIQSHDTVMVTAALEASGHFATQLAKAEGCHVIGTCADEDEVAFLHETGIDRVIRRNIEDVGAVLAEEYGDRITVVFDTLGGKMLDTCLNHVAPRARVIVVEALSEHLRDERAAHYINLYRQVIRRSVSIIGFNLSDYANAIPSESLKLLDQVQLGMLTSLIDPTTFEGLHGVADALAYLISGRSRGKIIVRL